MRTPRLDESMNVVFERSTTSRRTPSSIGRLIRCLNSGAVNRSISPVTDTTWMSSPRRLSSIANSMAIIGALPCGDRFQSGRIGQAYVQVLRLALRLDGDVIGQLLDDVADARDRGVDDEGLAAAGAQRADP